MKLNKDMITVCDAEIGFESILDKFLFNFDNLHTDDRKETFRNIILYNPKYTILETLALFNAIVNKLK